MIYHFTKRYANLGSTASQRGESYHPVVREITSGLSFEDSGKRLVRDTPYQPHAKPCTFPYKFGVQVQICTSQEFILPTTQSLQLAAAISVQKVLLLHLAMEPTELPAF